MENILRFFCDLYEATAKYEKQVKHLSVLDEASVR